MADFFSQASVLADSVATGQPCPLHLCHSAMLEIMFVIHMPVPEELPATFLWMSPARHHTHYPSLRTQKPWLKGSPGRLTLNHWEAESNRLLGDYSPTVSRPPLWTPRGFQLSMKEFRSNTLSSVKAEFIRMKRALRGMKAGNEYRRCRGGNHFRG